MATIPLSSGYTTIPEGEYVFRIEKVEYKEEFGKLKIFLVTQDGQKHVENYRLLDAKGEPNDGAMNAFSYLAKTALNDFDATEVDPEELVGCYFAATVVHDVQPSTREAGKTVTFVKLDEKVPADGFDGEAPGAGGQGQEDEVDLDDLLG